MDELLSKTGTWTLFFTPFLDGGRSCVKRLNKK